MASQTDEDFRAQVAAYLKQNGQECGEDEIDEFLMEHRGREGALADKLKTVSSEAVEEEEEEEQEEDEKAKEEISAWANFKRAKGANCSWFGCRNEEEKEGSVLCAQHAEQDIKDREELGLTAEAPKFMLRMLKNEVDSMVVYYHVSILAIRPGKKPFRKQLKARFSELFKANNDFHKTYQEPFKVSQAKLKGLDKEINTINKKLAKSEKLKPGEQDLLTEKKAALEADREPHFEEFVLNEKIFNSYRAIAGYFPKRQSRFFTNHMSFDFIEKRQKQLTQWLNKLTTFGLIHSNDDFLALFADSSIAKETADHAMDPQLLELRKKKLAALESSSQAAPKKETAPVTEETPTNDEEDGMFAAETPAQEQDDELVADTEEPAPEVEEAKNEDLFAAEEKDEVQEE